MTQSISGTISSANATLGTDRHHTQQKLPCDAPIMASISTDSIQQRDIDIV